MKGGESGDEARLRGDSGTRINLRRAESNRQSRAGTGRAASAPGTAVVPSGRRMRASIHSVSGSRGGGERPRVLGGELWEAMSPDDVAPTLCYVRRPR